MDEVFFIEISDEDGQIGMYAPDGFPVPLPTFEISKLFANKIKYEDIKGVCGNHDLTVSVVKFSRTEVYGERRLSKSLKGSNDT